MKRVKAKMINGKMHQHSFQFETDIEGGTLRRDVMAAGTIGTTPTTTGLKFIMSGQEELFAFRRAVSKNPCQKKEREKKKKKAKKKKNSFQVL